MTGIDRDGIVVLVGNPRSGSRTRQLGEATAHALEPLLTRLGGSGGIRVLELADVVGISFGPGPAKPSVAVADPHAVVRGARLLVVATPSYKGTFTGLLKVFLDQYGHRELAGVVAVPVVVAAAETHRIAAASALEALLRELGATVAVPGLAVLESGLSDPKGLADGWAAEHLASIVDLLPGGLNKAANEPDQP